jgi:hypothetical protein
MSISVSDPWARRAGAFMAFSAYHTASGFMEIVELYKIYVEGQPCDSSERIGRLLGYIVSSVASMFMGGWVMEVTLLSSSRTPELEYVGLLSMAMMYLIMLRGTRGGPNPTSISIAFIWLARLCLEGAATPDD